MQVESQQFVEVVTLGTALHLRAQISCTKGLLARYLLRPPVSLDWLQVDEHGQAIAYAARIRAGHEPQAVSAPLGPKDFLACLVMHIPDPRRHTIRY